ncbi:hypothetical protein [Hydromonas duriensis]|uniref:hypothetical protein n=1 Tax=Hydromonas duriensis TaxID=1527608 RepID=UPI0013C332E0|nr:hypothetical protein [Hydromonas duriensis]
MFLEFLNQKKLENPNYFDSISENDGLYTVGLVKVRTGAKAPKVTPEIEEIFLVNGVMPVID